MVLPVISENLWNGAGCLTTRRFALCCASCETAPYWTNLTRGPHHTFSAAQQYNSNPTVMPYSSVHYMWRVHSNRIITHHRMPCTCRCTSSQCSATVVPSSISDIFLKPHASWSVPDASATRVGTSGRRSRVIVPTLTSAAPLASICSNMARTTFPVACDTVELRLRIRKRCRSLRLLYLT